LKIKLEKSVEYYEKRVRLILKDRLWWGEVAEIKLLEGLTVTKWGLRLVHPGTG
jgi:hypothetical protein